jgi:PAS domain S-box-containing protein
MVVLPMLQMQGFANEINFEIKSKEDSFPSLFNATAVTDADGKILAYNAIILNITDRKKYESLLLTARQHAEDEKKRFEFLSNSIPNIIWTALPTGRINFINDRFFQIFGSKTSAIRFNSFMHLIHSTERKRTLTAWKKSLETRTSFEAEVRLKLPSQKYEWFLINAVAYEDKEGSIITWFGSCTNINEQKDKERLTVERLNESLYEAGEEITRNSKTLREIAFNQSHLIRHPLTKIMAIANIMNEMEMDEPLKQMVAMLQASADKLDNVIKDIVFKTAPGID